MIPKALKARKNMAATLVQRYVRGYIDFTNIRTIINQKKLRHQTPLQRLEKSANIHPQQ